MHLDAPKRAYLLLRCDTTKLLLMWNGTEPSLSPCGSLSYVMRVMYQVGRLIRLLSCATLQKTRNDILLFRIFSKSLSHRFSHLSHTFVCHTSKKKNGEQQSAHINWITCLIISHRCGWWVCDRPVDNDHRTWMEERDSISVSQPRMRIMRTRATISVWWWWTTAETSERVGMKWKI